MYRERSREEKSYKLGVVGSGFEDEVWGVLLEGGWKWHFPVRWGWFVMGDRGRFQWEFGGGGFLIWGNYKNYRVSYIIYKVNITFLKIAKYNNSPKLITKINEITVHLMLWHKCHSPPFVKHHFALRFTHYLP